MGDGANQVDVLTPLMAWVEMHKTPMVLVLQDGEEIHGVIEWYDKYCLKVNRTGASNLLLYKPSIKYMYKESEATPQRK